MYLVPDTPETKGKRKMAHCPNNYSRYCFSCHYSFITPNPIWTHELDIRFLFVVFSYESNPEQNVKY